MLGDRFVCRVLDVHTRAARTLPRAIGHLAPDGRSAVCEDFSRAWDFRPGYDGAYKLYQDDGSGEPKATLWQAPNGHQSYVPGTKNEWVVTDTV